MGQQCFAYIHSCLISETMQPVSMTSTAKVYHTLCFIWQYNDVDDQRELLAVAQTPVTSLMGCDQPDAAWSSLYGCVMQEVQRPTPTGKLWFSGRLAACPATARRSKSTSKPSTFCRPIHAVWRTCICPGQSTIQLEQCTKLAHARSCTILVFCWLLQSCSPLYTVQ